MHPHYDSPLLPHLGHAEQYKKVVTDKYSLSTLGNGNNCVQIQDDIAVKNNFLRVGNETFVLFQNFMHTESLFQNPIPSKHIGCAEFGGYMRVCMWPSSNISRQNIFFAQ